MEVKNGRYTKIVSGRRGRISASDAKAILDGWNAAAKETGKPTVMTDL
jgi:hypothetical protein